VKHRYTINAATGLNVGRKMQNTEAGIEEELFAPFNKRLNNSDYWDGGQN
jgi:hypothetical protein